MTVCEQPCAQRRSHDLFLPVLTRFGETFMDSYRFPFRVVPKVILSHR